jgi:acetyl esterase/lipase
MGFDSNQSPMQLMLRFSVILLTLVGLSGLSSAAKPERVSLWLNRAPVGGGAFVEEDTWITVHRPAKAKANGAAVVICPGGGYGGLVTGAEGHGIAAWLNRHGITGIVLEYRLPKGRSHVPLLDAQRALRTARANAKEWGLQTDRIGIIGFSAGGHLASTAGTHFDLGDPKAKHPADRLSSRPDFMILVYPVITMGVGTHGGSRDRLLGKNAPPELIKLFSNEKQVSAQTPPAYLAHAIDDKAVPVAHSRNFHAALTEKKIPAVYLELPDGGHGFNGYKGPSWDAWQNGSIKWLAKLGMSPSNTH